MDRVADTGSRGWVPPPIEWAPKERKQKRLRRKMIKRKKEMKLQHAHPFPHPHPTLFSSLTLHSSLKTASRQKPCPHQ